MQSNINNLKNFLDMQAGEGVHYAHAWHTFLLNTQPSEMAINLLQLQKIADAVALDLSYEKDVRGFAHKVWTQIHEILDSSVERVHDNVHKYLAMGREYYVHAIKEYRSAYNAPLKEAKEAVDKIIREHYPNFWT